MVISFAIERKPLELKENEKYYMNIYKKQTEQFHGSFFRLVA